MDSLADLRHIPILDGHHAHSYAELREPLPAICGLDAIRHLTIGPGHWDAPICGRLSRHFIDECPLFEALSYTWNGAVFKQPISFNDADVPVTENVHNALRELRYADKHRTIWVDSVCIDQRNVVEKNQQVRLMNSIYGSCTNVICWMGVPCGIHELCSHALTASAQGIAKFGHDDRPSFPRI